MADQASRIDEDTELSPEVAGTTRYGTLSVEATPVVDMVLSLHQRPCSHKWGLILSFLFILSGITSSLLQVKSNPGGAGYSVLLGSTYSGKNRKSRTTTRTLLLLRHAKSSWDDPDSDDFDRPSAATGQESALRLGRYLAENKVEPPDMIFMSPSQRTRQTLALVRANGWAENVPVTLDERLYDFSSDDSDGEATKSYVDFVSRQLDEQFKRVLIVGHNPPIGALARLLLPHNMVSKFSRGTFCEVFWTELDTWKAFMNKRRQLGLWLQPKRFPW